MVATVITGVSRGLGKALFDELAGRGHRLLALGRHFTDDQHRLAAAEPDRISLHEVDLSGAPPSSAGLAGFLGADATEPAVLIHNAGVVEPIGAVGTLDPAELSRSVQVNLLAPMMLTNSFLAARGDRPARVLFVSSGAASKPVGGWAAYCATKAGGEMFFTVAADELGDDDRVRIVNVNPGAMDTDMQAVLRGSTGWFPRREHYVRLAERGELPSPAGVAAGIVAEHLADL
jgi:NAD(P)-dependent dehydrogenase (short-subunit alcohol dehydrogenase family)